MGRSADLSSEIVRAIKAAVKIPLFAKLTPEGGNVANVAKALFAAGADAVGSTGNRLGIPPIDLDDPAKSAFQLQDEISMSCYSGAWLKPLAQRDAYEIRTVCGPDAFIMATGGITNWRDAVEMILCGGNLLGVCAETLLRGYDIVRPMVAGLKDYMDQKGYTSLDDFRGALTGKVKEATTVTLRDGYAHIVEPNLSAPCKSACPNHVLVQAFIQKVKQGSLRAAYDLITGAGAPTGLCDERCPAPCEAACLRGATTRRCVSGSWSAMFWNTAKNRAGSPPSPRPHIRRPRNRAR